MEYNHRLNKHIYLHIMWSWDLIFDSLQKQHQRDKLSFFKKKYIIIKLNYMFQQVLNKKK